MLPITVAYALCLPWIRGGGGYPVEAVAVCFTAKQLGLEGIWVMLGLGRCVMLVCIEDSFVVILLQFYPAVQVAAPILGEVVVLLEAFC